MRATLETLHSIRSDFFYMFWKYVRKRRDSVDVHCRGKEESHSGRVDGLPDRLGGSCYFSMLDLAGGYRQIPVYPEKTECHKVYMISGLRSSVLQMLLLFSNA